MIDEEIIQYLEEKIAEAYPQFTREQYIITLPQGKIGAGRMTCKDLAVEILPAFISIQSDNRFDRTPFIKALGGTERTILLNKQDVECQYLGHEYRSYTEITGCEETIFKLEFAHYIKR